MTQALKVAIPGIHTTVQDAGRPGYQGVGVPVSGPLDRVSFRLANALVGNSPGTPALEMLFQGPALEVLADSVRVALVGCNSNIEVRTDNGRIIPAGQSVRLARGEVFKIGRLEDSVCAYLAIEGGLDVATALGSASTYVRGALGGFNGRALRKGDLLPVARMNAEMRAERVMSRPLDLAHDQPIRVVLGPQADYFTDAAIKTFLTSEYCVSDQADRMGYRLDGPALAHAKGYDIASDGVAAGAIQVPGSGMPIVLMVEAPTTGGYPKIATVISADIPVLGRRRRGQTIHFAAVDAAEAEALRRGQEAFLQQCAREFGIAAN
ncbi:MAG: biotin-dependent carboxyltransferase family protein [Proteobacteria bacterium]|nr:biotin-dependent carboxyltransferase family protein [Pseudomonadota bacterium]